MTSFEFGEIVLLPFVYSDLQASKRRPALVLLDAGDDDILVAKVTSKPHGSDYDVSLKLWQEAGLYLPSFARVHKLLTAEKNQVIDRLGVLQRQDLQAVQKAFRSLIKY